jgi:6-hydroxytryprostatin B O-methyltransferase
MILHDWPEEQAVTILRNLVPALKTSSRILIMDTVLPSPGSVPSSVERLARARDLTMWQTFNSQERDLNVWEKLLAAADHNLRLVNVVHPFGSVMSIMEIVLGV